ncbi:phage integrase SAM-like domain-containing protein [Bacteroides graminisolvens]|uniref:phage integrase SAM-like domain-containing protein n=1 Tax=Bacteroides graminisolvens TaxID=477666 RepID=UPI003B7406CA
MCRYAYRHLKDFLATKYNVTNIPFGKVDIIFIEAYLLYLKLELRMTLKTVKYNLIPLRAYITKAKHKGLIRQDSFFDYVSE